MDKENIFVQFVTVTPKDMLTFETIIFICQVLVTLEGTSVIDLNFCFVNTVEEQLLFPSSHNVTRMKYEHIRLCWLKVYFFTQEEPLSQRRGVSVLGDYPKPESEKQTLWTWGQINPLGVLRAKSGSLLTPPNPIWVSGESL